MKSTKYSDKVLDHFKNPRNVGILEKGDIAIGKVGNPVCGDLMEIYIEVEDDVMVISEPTAQGPKAIAIDLLFEEDIEAGESEDLEFDSQ